MKRWRDGKTEKWRDGGVEVHLQRDGDGWHLVEKNVCTRGVTARCGGVGEATRVRVSKLYFQTKTT